MSYLHPSQRAQATAQIGPSSHENNYHVGVLQGNWYEERFSFGPQPSSSFKFTATSEACDIYRAATSEAFRDSKQPQVCPPEAPRSLLLGQGKPVISMQSVAELSYTDPTKGEVRNTKAVLAAEGHSPRKGGTVGKRIENGTMDAETVLAARDAAATASAAASPTSDGDAAASLDGTVASAFNASNSGASIIPAYLRNAKAEAQFLTTKNITHDAAAEYCKRHPEAYTKGKCNARGEVIKTLDDPMTRTQLRK